jgi:magnesium-protoporphyrin IX monomethyl ester (oxidative) cyclase
MLWKFSTVYNPERQYADHQQPVRYEMRPPRPLAGAKPSKQELYVHMPTPVH